MDQEQALKLLFIINPGSGKRSIDWPGAIDHFFGSLPHIITKYFLEPGCNIDTIKDKINAADPDRVIAVGGDGTVKLVAECLLHTNTVMGILPAGSANGLAKELGIPSGTDEAMRCLVENLSAKIHLIKINNQLCVHLSDTGFNASVIKIFQDSGQRGMAGYIKAAWKVLWKHAVMRATIQIDENHIIRNAAMIVIANATRYGSGAIINPAGRLDDDLFEVVIIKKVSFSEIFKMMVTHQPYNPEKTEVYQTQSLHISSKKKVQFQIDGEYQGRVNEIDAVILKDALNIIKYT